VYFLVLTFPFSPFKLYSFFAGTLSFYLSQEFSVMEISPEKKIMIFVSLISTLMLSYIYKKKSQEQNMQNNNLIP
jgi:hypothetical protein